MADKMKDNTEEPANQPSESSTTTDSANGDPKSAVMIEVNESSSEVWRELWDMRKDSQMCDVQLVGYDNVHVPAHSCVLAAASVFLRETVTQNSAQHRSITLQVPDICSRVILQLLNFIYLGRLSVDQSDLSELTLAARMLKLPKLVKVCSLVTGEEVEMFEPTAQDVTEDISETNNETKNSKGKTKRKKAATTDKGSKKKRIKKENDDVSDEANNDVTMAISDITENVVEAAQLKTEGVFDEVVAAISENTSGLVSDHVTTDGGKRLVTIELQVNTEEDAANSKFVQKAYVNVPSCTVDSLENTSEPKAIEAILAHANKDKKKTVIVNAEGEPQYDGPFYCGVKDCKKEYSSLDALSAHRRDKHVASEYVYTCEVCGKAFKYKHNVRHHMERHLERMFACKICDKSFFTKPDLTTHQRTHSGQRPFKCEFCSKDFTQSCNLLKHKRSVHNDVFMQGARPHECTECHKTFKTQDMLHKHMKRHSQKLTCALCNQHYRLRKDLMKHQKQEHHMAYMPAKEEHSLDVFKCNLCERSFLDLRRLALHQETVHTKTKRYACPFPQCHYQAFYKYAVERHFQKHGKEPFLRGVDTNFTCEFCQAEFGTKCELSYHVDNQICKEGGNVDNGKIHICNDCSSSFQSAQELDNHVGMKLCQLPLLKVVKRGAKVVPVRTKKVQLVPLTCVECSQQFTDSGAFKNHMIHSACKLQPQNIIPVTSQAGAGHVLVLENEAEEEATCITQAEECELVMEESTICDL